jgi:hypothetical protein
VYVVVAKGCICHYNIDVRIIFTSSLHRIRGIDMREKDFNWFVKNHSSLYEKYGHVFLVIKDETVIGNHPTYAQAVRETIKKVPLGTFIVEECTEDDSGYTNYVATIGAVRI